MRAGTCRALPENMLRAASEFASNAALIFSSTIRLLSRLAAAPPFTSFAILNTMTAGALAPNLIELAAILGQEVFLLRMAAASFEYATIGNYDKCKSILTVEAIFWERLMKLDRDMDLIRQLLLEIEGGKINFNTCPVMEQGRPDLENARRCGEHLCQLQKAGLIEAVVNAAAGSVIVQRITWRGHDLLDSIRDPNIWEKTKRGVEGAGGFTVDLLSDLAKGFMKKQIEEIAGVKL